MAGGATYDDTDAARRVNTLTGAGSVINANGLTVQRGNFSGIISGTGSLTKTGAETLTLTGANTFTGALAIDAGNLTSGTSGSLQASSLSLGANTVFDYSTATAYNAASPTAFKNVTVNGLGATITPNSGHYAGFNAGTLYFSIPNAERLTVADSLEILLSISRLIDAEQQGTFRGN